MMGAKPMNKQLKFDALKTLREKKIGVLSTVSGAGDPWSAVVHFLVDQDFNFYFLTRKSTLKYKNLANSGKAAFNVGFSEDPLDNFQIVGKIKPLRGTSDWRMLMLTLFSQRQLNNLHMDASAGDPFFGYKGHDFVMLVLKPKFVRWLKSVKAKPIFEIVLP